VIIAASQCRIGISIVKYITLIGLATALLFARPAYAQTDDTLKLKLPMIIWSAAVAADQTTTYQFSSQYPDILHERNPLIRRFDSHPALLVSAGSAIDLGTAWAAQHFFGERHPRLVKLAFYGAAAYRTYLAVYNMRMMQQARALTAPAPLP
jgi:hypothetical protein